MTAEPALASTPQELHDALVAKYSSGGATLSVVHMELIFALVRLFAELRKAPVSNVPKLIAAINQTESMLPPAGKAAGTALDRLHQHIAENHRVDVAGEFPADGRYADSGEGVERAHGPPSGVSQVS